MTSEKEEAKDAEAAPLASATITEEMIDSMRKMTGTRLRTEGSRNNEEATYYAVLRFADGIGDDNPLWIDREYAALSPFRGIVAPPSWVFCCFAGVQFGWPGIGGFHSSTEMNFYRPVRLGDRILPETVYEGFEGPHPSSFAGRAVTDQIRTTYRNNESKMISEAVFRVVRFERGPARERSGERKIELPHAWSEDELTRIEDDILSERPRGNKTLWWENVQIGDEVDTITKGPIGLTDEIAFVASGAAPIPRLAAHGVALRRYKKHPGWAYRDPVTSALEPVYAVHYSNGAARAMGVEAAYDVGVQRTCWLIHMLTHWGGDEAWLKQVSCEYRGFVFFSDVVRLSGRVTEKFVDSDGDSVVRVETECINQRGKNVMPGGAIIALRSKGGLSPAERFAAQ